MCKVLDQLVDSNLIYMHSANSIMKVTEFSVMKPETDIFNLLETMKILT
jgi:hypothetical protein